MALPDEFYEFENELTVKYGNDWVFLPDEHPDIVKLQMLAGNKPTVKKKNKNVYWNEERLKFLRENYLNMTNHELARYFKKSDFAIREVLYRFRMFRPDDKKKVK